ncbi:hypothetical protein LEMLEM_LOCUS8805 [Lemmus lemmus]
MGRLGTLEPLELLHWIKMYLSNISPAPGLPVCCRAPYYDDNGPLKLGFQSWQKGVSSSSPTQLPLCLQACLQERTTYCASFSKPGPGLWSTDWGPARPSV